MANPDRAYGDDSDMPGWVIILVIVVSIVSIIVAIVDKDDTPKCSTYYQGDELVEDCEPGYEGYEYESEF